MKYVGTVAGEKAAILKSPQDAILWFRRQMAIEPGRLVWLDTLRRCGGVEITTPLLRGGPAGRVKFYDDSGNEAGHMMVRNIELD